MNWQGWVFMLLAWGVVGSLFFYCFYRILFGDHSLGAFGISEKKAQEGH